MTPAAHGGGVVTLGETMALVASTSFGPLQHTRTMNLGIGGSESNMAIALSRLGTQATWIGKVGADSLGDLVVREIGAEGVHVVAPRDQEAPTALMVKEYRTSVDTHVWYYRKDNAGSRLRADEVDPDLIRNAALLHVTGISPALSDTMAHTVDEAIRIAKESGTIVSFDLNFRGKLWSRERAKEAYQRIIPLADIVFAGDDEAAIAVGRQTRRLSSRIAWWMPAPVRRSSNSAREARLPSWTGSSNERAAIKVPAIDTVGAGDAFVAGYLADFLLGADVPTRLTTAVTVGYACLTSGDWEGTPRRHELALLGGAEPVSR